MSSLHAVELKDLGMQRIRGFQIAERKREQKKRRESHEMQLSKNGSGAAASRSEPIISPPEGEKKEKPPLRAHCCMPGRACFRILRSKGGNRNMGTLPLIFL